MKLKIENPDFCKFDDPAHRLDMKIKRLRAQYADAKARARALRNQAAAKVLSEAGFEIGMDVVNRLRPGAWRICDVRGTAKHYWVFSDPPGTLRVEVKLHPLRRDGGLNLNRSAEWVAFTDLYTDRYPSTP